MFFFSSRRRHTRCALVTGVQTCALPICQAPEPVCFNLVKTLRAMADIERISSRVAMQTAKPRDLLALRESLQSLPQVEQLIAQIGRASCRERVCQYV